MANGTLSKRVDALEVETKSIRGEVNELRTEMRNGFARLEERIVGTGQSLEQRIDNLGVDLRREMVALNADTIRAMEALHTQTNLRMDDLNAQTRSHALMLHEDLVARIVAIGEGRPGRKRPRR